VHIERVRRDTTFHLHFSTFNFQSPRQPPLQPQPNAPYDKQADDQHNGGPGGEHLVVMYAKLPSPGRGYQTPRDGDEPAGCQHGADRIGLHRVDQIPVRKIAKAGRQPARRTRDAAGDEIKRTRRQPELLMRSHIARSAVVRAGIQSPGHKENRHPPQGQQHEGQAHPPGEPAPVNRQRFQDGFRISAW
jgi:hypothetical protein